MDIIRYNSDNPDPVDVAVGAEVRIQRTLAGLSQQKLGKALGLTFQQIQKYERGANRMGASRLHKIAQIFAIPVGDLFAGVDGKTGRPLAREGEPFKRRHLEMVRAFDRLPPKLQKSFFDHLKAVAREAGQETKLSGDVPGITVKVPPTSIERAVAAAAE